MHGARQHSDMSTVAIDLFIQDFVLSNRILNRHCDWATLVSRRFQETAPARKIFQFRSGDADHLASAEILALPDGDCLRIEVDRPDASRGAEEHRFDCLRMMHQATHTELKQLEFTDDETIVLYLITRNRGLINVAFVLHGKPRMGKSPYLVGTGSGVAAVTP